MCEILGVQVDSRLSIREHNTGLCKKVGIYIYTLSTLSMTFDLPTKLVLMQNFCVKLFYFLPNRVAFCQYYEN